MDSTCCGRCCLILLVLCTCLLNSSGMDLEIVEKIDPKAQKVDKAALLDTIHTENAVKGDADEKNPSGRSPDYNLAFLKDLCLYVGVSYVRNPRDPICKYVWCWNGHPFTMSCPPGLRVHRFFYWSERDPCTKPDTTDRCLLRVLRHRPAGTQVNEGHQKKYLEVEYNEPNSETADVYDQGFAREAPPSEKRPDRSHVPHYENRDMAETDHSYNGEHHKSQETWPPENQWSDQNNNNQWSNNNNNNNQWSNAEWGIDQEGNSMIVEMAPIADGGPDFGKHMKDTPGGVSRGYGSSVPSGGQHGRRRPPVATAPVDAHPNDAEPRDGYRHHYPPYHPPSPPVMAPYRPRPPPVAPHDPPYVPPEVSPRMEDNTITSSVQPPHVAPVPKQPTFAAQTAEKPMSDEKSDDLHSGDRSSSDTSKETVAQPENVDTTTLPPTDRPNIEDTGAGQDDADHLPETSDKMGPPEDVDTTTATTAQTPESTTSSTTAATTLPAEAYESLKRTPNPNTLNADGSPRWWWEFDY